MGEAYLPEIGGRVRHRYDRRRGKIASFGGNRPQGRGSARWAVVWDGDVSASVIRSDELLPDDDIITRIGRLDPDRP